MSIEIFAFPPSTRAFNVMAVANYLDMDFTLRFLDLSKGEQQKAEYVALNPNMRMPTMKDGDVVMWEANAITQYLALKKPQSGLLPLQESARLDVTRWQFWDVAHWEPACGVYAFEYVAKGLLGMGGPDVDAVAKAAEAFNRAAKVLDGQLKGKKYITGEHLTLPDFAIGAWMNYAEMAYYPVTPYEEIRRWFASLQALPAWQKTLAQAQL